MLESPGRSIYGGILPTASVTARSIAAGLLSALLSTERLPDRCLIRWALSRRDLGASDWRGIHGCPAASLTALWR